MRLVEKYLSRIKEFERRQEFQLSYILRFCEIMETQNRFEAFRNIHLGEEFVIVATGPSLREFQLIDNCNYIGVNKAYQKKEINFNYFFLQDYAAVKPYADEILKSVSCTAFIAKYVMQEDTFRVQFPKKYIEDLKAIPYFTSWPLSIMSPDISRSPFMNCGSVTFAAIQFALFCGASKIYLVGCDSNAGGYFDGTRQINPKVTVNTERLIENYKRLKEYAALYYPECKIYSINPVGLKGIFEDIYQVKER